MSALDADDAPAPAAAIDVFTCANCQAEARDAYCGACGQKRVRPGDLSLAHAWRHLVDELLDVDGRIFRTLRVLFTKPGQLTAEYLAGRRAQYVHPLRLFLVISGLYFLAEVQTISPSRVVHGQLGRPAREALRAQVARGGDSYPGNSYPVRLARLDDQIRVVFKIAFISTVVVNGAWFWVIFRRSRPYLAEHMVMALHLSSVTMTATMISSWLARQVNAEAWMGGVVAGLTQVYGSLAFRRVYPGHKAGALVAIVTTILIDFAILLGVTIVALRVATGLPLF